jgi:hypothetical protein
MAIPWNGWKEMDSVISFLGYIQGKIVVKLVGRHGNAGAGK